MNIAMGTNTVLACSSVNVAVVLIIAMDVLIFLSRHINTTKAIPSTVHSAIAIQVNAVLFVNSLFCVT